MANGNLIIAGSIQGEATFGTTNFSSEQSAFLAKYSATGGVLWARSLPSLPAALGSWPRTLATDPQGNIYLAGELQAEVVATNTTFTNYIYRLFVSKYNAAGTLLWTAARTNRIINPVEEGGGVWVSGSALDAAGNYFVAGSFSGSFIIGTTNLQKNGNG